MPENPLCPARAQAGAKLARLRRLSGYAFWSAAAFALPIALDRLIVAPVLVRHLGTDVFGAFVWVLGIVNVIGLATAAGFSNFLMRDLARRSSEDARKLMRTTLVLTTALGAPALLVGGVVSYRFADELVQLHAWVLYGPLLVFGLVRCIEWIIITSLRIRRLFVTVFLLKAAEGAVLLSILLVASRRDLTIIGTIYTASVLVPLGLGCYLTRVELGSGSWWDGAAAKLLMSAWSGLALSALIEQSLVYTPRIVLGALCGSEAVTVLFASVSIGSVFTMPVGLAGGLVLALLARRTEFALAGRTGIVYLGLCLALGIVIGLASRLAGPLLVRYLYPELAPRSLTFYHWIAIANGCIAIVLLLRPVVLKYARIRSIAWLSLSTLGLQIVALFLLVPSQGPYGGPQGAAIALALSSFVAMALWLSCYGRLMYCHSPAAADAEVTDDATT